MKNLNFELLKYGLICFCFWSLPLFAMHPPVVDSEEDEEGEIVEDDYEEYQIGESDFIALMDSLFSRLQRTRVDSERLAYADTITELMRLELRKPDSFTRSFKPLRYIGKISSSDGKVAVYTWNILLNRGFDFCGMVQTAEGEVYELSEPKQPFLPDERRMLRNNQWYGALYYELIPYKWEGEVVYLLAGWGRYRYATQFKVIDVLRLTDGGIELGVPLFDDHKEQFHRIVLESDYEAGVTLRYDARKRRFVFDHLSPMRQEGNVVESLGPDMSYDSYVKKRNRWVLKEDVKMKNAKK